MTVADILSDAVAALREYPADSLSGYPEPLRLQVREMAAKMDSLRLKLDRASNAVTPLVEEDANYVRAALQHVFPILYSIRNAVQFQDGEDTGILINAGADGGDYAIESARNGVFVSTIRHSPGLYNPHDGGSPPEDTFEPLGGGHYETLTGAVRAIACAIACARLEAALTEMRIGRTAVKSYTDTNTNPENPE